MKWPVSAACFLFAVVICASLASGQTPAVRQIKGGILNGKAVSLPQPEYPAEARAAGLEGVVYVEVTIDEEGNVISAVASAEPRKMRRSGDDPETIEVPAADPILREAAERAALEAKFSPTRLGGVPVKVTGTITYSFSMSRGEIARVPGTISGGILNGKASTLPKPPYPAAAIAVRAQGAVVVQVTVDENGDVISAAAVSGHPLLRAASVEAARGAKFAPTFLSGQPVKISGVITYNFVAPSVDEN